MIAFNFPRVWQLLAVISCLLLVYAQQNGVIEILKLEPGEIFHSPLGRHELEDALHFVLFVIHDITAILSCAYFVYLFRSSKDDPSHVIVGRICGLNFLLTSVSGFFLIAHRKSESAKHITSGDLNRITITTQGFNILAIGVNALLIKRYWNPVVTGLGLISFHMYNMLLGYRSLKFLLTMMLSASSPANHVEVGIELLILITLPQLLIDALYIAIHVTQLITGYKHFAWWLHHGMSVPHLVHPHA